MTMSHRARGALASFLALAACHSSNDQQKRATPAVPVRVASVARIDAPITISASGVVEPMQTVNVEAQATGTVLEVSFRQGDWVAAGQVLFRLDPRPLQDALEQARAALARDEAQATAAQHDAARYATLAGEGYVTRSQAEQTHATALAQAATVVADRASVRTAQRNLSYATIRAPIAGRTGSVRLRRGDLVGPQTGALVVINQLRPIQVRFPVLAGDFDLLRAAVATHPLPVTATSGDSTNIHEVGTLNFLDNAIDSLTGTVTGRAVFANNGGRMWPGQLVFLTVEAGVQRGVLAVPTPAIQTGQQGAYVYVVDPRQKTAQTRFVAADRTVGDVTLVSSGLNVGEQVVTDGQSRLNQGSRVAVVAPNGQGGAGGDSGRGLAGGGGGGSPGGEVATVPGAAAAGAGGGAGAGAAGAGASGVSAGAVSTEGGSGVAASTGRASAYSGAPNTSGQAPGTAASQTVAPGATQAPVGSAVVPQPAAGARGGVEAGVGVGTGSAGTGAATAGAAGATVPMGAPVTVGAPGPTGARGAATTAGGARP